MRKITNRTIVNYILQFLFIRLTLVTQNGNPIEYAMMYWIVPLTGWCNNFIFIGAKRFKTIKRITHAKTTIKDA